MPDDFKSRSELRAIDRTLERRQLDQALALARDYYDPDKEYAPSQLFLLSITFSATIRWGAGLDLEEKQIADRLWKQAMSRTTKAVEEDAANHGIRLAEIYLGRREIDLAYNALRTIKKFVSYGALSLRYNRAIDSYVELSNRSDTDLWIN